MDKLLTRGVVFEAIDQHAEYQDARWGSYKEQSLAGYILLMEKKLNDAKKAWMHNGTLDDSVMAEILKTTTVGVRALETYGLNGTVKTVRDICISDFKVDVSKIKRDTPAQFTLKHAPQHIFSRNARTIISFRHIDPDFPEIGSVVYYKEGLGTGPISSKEVAETVVEVASIIYGNDDD